MASEKPQKDEKAQVSVHRELFNSSLMAALRSEGEDPDLYRNDVLTGALEYHAVYVGGVYAYALLLRVDRNRDGSTDLVCIHAIATAPAGKTDVRKAVWPYLKAVAKRAGLNRVRAHTKKDAMGRVMESEGFYKSESVYVCEVQ